MAQTWNTQIVDWYERALLWSDYPRRILGQIFEEEITPGDTVLDAGCGIGTISLFVADLCQRVIAVDTQLKALQTVREKAQKAGHDNLVTYLGSWPDVDVEQADVTICSYAPPISRTARGLDKLIDVTKRTGIILTPFQDVKENDTIKELAHKLGLQREYSSCANGCWEKGFLESKGIAVQCRSIIHDFSQPVNDYQEAWQFLRQQLDAPKDLQERALKEIPAYLQSKNGQLFIPIIRKNCLIVFRK